LLSGRSLIQHTVISDYYEDESLDDRLIRAQFHDSWRNETTGEIHIVFNLIHNVTFFPDLDLWDDNGYKDITELPEHIASEITHFFEVYKQLESKQTAIKEILGREQAENIIKEAIDLYNQKFKN